MTISSPNAKAGPYIADGMTAQYPFHFRVLDPSHIKIEHEGEIFGYEIQLQEDGTGSVVFTNPLPKGTVVTILRDVPATQETDLQNNTAFFPEVLETAYDKLTMICQQLKEETDRSVKVSPTESTLTPDELLHSIKASETASKTAAQNAEQSAQAAEAAAAEAAEDAQEVVAESVEAAARSAAEAAEAAEEAAEAAQEAAEAGVPIGSIYAYPAATPPAGAYLLNGQTIASCATLYPKFYEWVQTAGVRLIDTETYDSELSSTGNCGGFVVDTDAGSVRLPSLTNGVIWGGDSGSIGGSVAAGLPNIKGSGWNLMGRSSSDWTGVFSSTPESFYSTASGDGVSGGELDFNASRSNPIYGNSETVQPPAIKCVWCIQVYNAATELSTQESAQLASQMQTYLPLTGGTVTGDILLSGANPTIRGTSDGDVTLFLLGGTAWSTAPHIVLRGQGSSVTPGGAQITAVDANGNQKTLHINPDGTLKFLGKDITLGYPNYSAAIVTSGQQRYTAPQDGWVYFDSGDLGGVFINDNKVGKTDYGSTVFVPVRKGDVARIDAPLNKKITFFPNR